MFKIFQYSFTDQIRSRLALGYTAFFLLICSTLFYFSTDPGRGMISLMNIILMLIPLTATLYGINYFYNSREFLELILAQPVSRRKVFAGHFLGLSLALALSFIIGIGLPFLFMGIHYTEYAGSFLWMLFAGIALGLIFSALSYWIGLSNENRVRGFSIALMVWLFAAVVYDGLVLAALLYLEDYPIEMPAIAMSIFNPIDLSRIMIMLEMDQAALFGYTGAVFRKFFGSSDGILISAGSLMLWITLPIIALLHKAHTKDF